MDSDAAIALRDALTSTRAIFSTGPSAERVSREIETVATGCPLREMRNVRPGLFLTHPHAICVECSASVLRNRIGSALQMPRATSAFSTVTSLTVSPASGAGRESAGIV